MKSLSKLAMSKKTIVAFIIIITSIIIDHFTKYKALSLKTKEVVIIPDKLKLIYLENRGAGFGILQDKKIFLILFTAILIGVLLYVLFKNITTYSYLTVVSLALCIGGAFGNFIDRLLRGYVIDFISYKFTLFNGYEFPVFNFGDIFVVVGCILLIIVLFFTEDLGE